MAQTREEQIANLRRVVRRAMVHFRPPEEITVSEWADKYRYLSSEASAEPGLWRTSRTPYLKEPMDAFTDPVVERIVMVSASQIGKSELELNIIGYIIDQDPGPILYIQPTVEDAKKFSRQRLTPMFRDSKRLKRKIAAEAKLGRSSSTETVLQRTFPGGMLTMAGSNVASALASMPIRYLIGDERDRWAKSAGREGDPWELGRARQRTFHNSKAIEVSTPTIKDASNIAASFSEGTQEHWCSKCPECGEWTEIDFDDLHFTPVSRRVDGKDVWDVDGGIVWGCPHCGCAIDEDVIRRAPAKWIAENPSAYEERRTRSFWLNAFCSPWVPWKTIVLKFLDAKDDPEKLMVVYNTMFGRLWEDRGDLQTEDEMLARREDYGQCADGGPVELPDGVLVLTCGVDVQADRLEYEVVGHGRYGETWGIERGMIMGRPDADGVWARLDQIVARRWRYGDGQTLKLSLTCVDSGFMTQYVYAACWRRSPMRVFPIKGKGGENVPYVRPPTKTYVDAAKRRFVWLYTLGVDEGKSLIMSALRVEEPGPKYCHFPLRPEAGYDLGYFGGLLSERRVQSTTSKVGAWRWEKLPGHQRNEALDCRNYAMAALRILNFDMDALYRKRLAQKQGKTTTKKRAKSVNHAPKRAHKDALGAAYEGW